MMTASSQILQDDQNFLVEIIDWQDKKAVKKTVKPTASDSRAARVKNDVLGMNFFAGLIQKHQLNLHVPQVYDSGEGFYIREFIQEEPVVSDNTPDADANERLEKLSALLAAIDRLEPGENIGYTGSSNYQNLEQSIPRWADENIADSIITPEEGKRAKELAAELGKYLNPRIAHGDMSPYKHAYLRADGKITLIDYENFTSHAARYFDVAWTYTRLWSFAESTDIPKHFLAKFLELAEPVNHQEEQLFAVILQRTLGMQKDAYYDEQNRDLHYKPRAKELLEIVLKGNINLLYK